VTTTLERAVVELWKGGAARLHHGECDDCHRVTDDDGRPLQVARQERARLFLCVECWNIRTAGGRRSTA